MLESEIHNQDYCSWRRDRVFWIILSLAFLLGLVYNFVIIPGLGPDEHRHFNYVKLLIEEHRLPFLLPNGSEYHGAGIFHPPLYYLFLIPLYLIGNFLPGDAIWHVMRLGSLALCVLALPLIYDLAFAAAGKQVARFATLLVGWIPMWGMTAGTINNDSACFFFIVLFLWLLVVRYPEKQDYRSAIILGIVLGLGTLCKATVLLCAVLALLIYLWMQYGQKVLLSPRAWGRLGTTIGVGTLIAGWWHVRSFMIYGQFTPLPPSMPTPFLPNPSVGKLVMLMHPNFPMVFGYANLRIFETIWSQKDWLLMSNPPIALYANIRNAIYVLFVLIPLIAIIGYVVQYIRQCRSPEERAAEVLSAKMARWLSASAFIIIWITVLQVALFWHWGWAEGGRYLLPGLCGYTIWAGRGWKFLTGTKLKIVTAAISIFLLSVNGIAIFWLITYLNPTFGPH
jgi:4-amino-4-deoxy-L-arabinose transferase-like glycosyltransferase